MAAQQRARLKKEGTTIIARTIVVTGVTGNIGSGLVPSLIAKGASVRALVREPSAAQGLTDAGVEVVVGDLDRPETLDAAFRGADKVFLPAHAHQPEPDHTGSQRHRRRQARGRAASRSALGGCAPRGGGRSHAGHEAARCDRGGAGGLRPHIHDPQAALLHAEPADRGGERRLGRRALPAGEGRQGRHDRRAGHLRGRRGGPHRRRLRGQDVWA